MTLLLQLCHCKISWKMCPYNIYVAERQRCAIWIKKLCEPAVTSKEKYVCSLQGYYAGRIRVPTIRKSLEFCKGISRLEKSREKCVLV